MEKKKLVLRNSITNSLLLTTGVLIFSAMIFSCNSGEKSKEPEKKPEQTNTNQQQPLTSLEGFPILYTEFQKITDIFNEPGVGLRHKIVFQFYFDGDAVSGQPTLSAFPARNNRHYPSALPALILDKSSLSEKLAYPLYMGTIELTKDEYITLSKDPKKETYIVFTPVKSLNHKDVITYTTAWSSTKAFSKDKLVPIKINKIGSELNPSPPKDPS